MFPHLVRLSLSKRCVEWEYKEFSQKFSKWPDVWVGGGRDVQDVRRRGTRLFAGIARRVWFRRNEIVRGGSFTHPNVLVQQARDAVAYFSAANTREVATISAFEEPNGGNSLCSL